MQAERDQLLAEKENWRKVNTTSTEEVGAATLTWEAEKAELLKSRDEALEKAKVKTSVKCAFLGLIVLLGSGSDFF